MTSAMRSETFMFDRAAETMPRGALEALQLHRLKETIGRAYAKVAPFRRKLDAAGVKPDSLKTLADIVRFPFTVKSELRDNFPFGLFAVPREDVLRSEEHTSELQSRFDLVCRLLLEKKKKK